MDLNEFTKRIEEFFIEGDVSLTPETDFRANDEFDSLIGYSIIVFMQDKCNYKMTVEEFLLCKTTKDLYNKIYG